MFLRIFLLIIFLNLMGCTSTSHSPVDDLLSETLHSANSSNKPIRAGAPNSLLLASNSNLSNGTVSGTYREGTGNFVSQKAHVIDKSKIVGDSKGYTLNLVDAPVRAVAQQVLGEILKINYTLDPRVQANMTLQTPQPVSKATLVDLFESALSASGSSIVRRGANYMIVPSADALALTPPVSVPTSSAGSPGVSVQVIELAFIAANEMRTILEPISRPGAILRTDANRNHIVVSGDANDLSAIREAIAVFDVDWMRGRSVSLQPLTNSKPSAIVSELEAVFSSGSDGNSLIRFIPNDRLNSVLVITSSRAYLKRASDWIKKLDQNASTNDEQLFVYQIQNRPVKELADILQSVLRKESMPMNSEAATKQASTVAPDLTAETVQSDGISVPIVQQASLQQEPQISNGQSRSSSVVADEENNALLISTTPNEYKRIEQILRQLDVLPTQVMLEAVIAEVTLNDELKFGLRWAVESGKFKFNLSDVASGFAGGSLPGAAWSFVSNDLQVTLNALSSLTNVNIVSAPNIMALNNQKASLQVGDQVPIVTQQSTGTLSTNAPIVNSVTLKDTGIILTVTPRINTSGRVLLDIDQEVSSVAKTTTSGIDSPTIHQRKLSTKVIVNDGESIALGGLIQETNSLERGQVPIVGDIPIFGNLFKNKTDGIKRTELIIFIRPRVVRNINEARDVTKEFRDKLNFESALTPRRKGKTVLERDVNRLKY